MITENELDELVRQTDEFAIFKGRYGFDLLDTEIELQKATRGNLEDYRRAVTVQSFILSLKLAIVMTPTKAKGKGKKEATGEK